MMITQFSRMAAPLLLANHLFALVVGFLLSCATSSLAASDETASGVLYQKQKTPIRFEAFPSYGRDYFKGNLDGNEIKVSLVDLLEFEILKVYAAEKSIYSYDIRVVARSSKKEFTVKKATFEQFHENGNWFSASWMPIMVNNPITGKLRAFLQRLTAVFSRTAIGDVVPAACIRKGVTSPLTEIVLRWRT